MSNQPLGLVFEGMDGVQRMLGIVATAFDDAAIKLAMEGLIRETPCPGLSVPVVDQAFTLEQHARDLFANEGTSSYSGQKWTRYGDEPKYAAYKRALRAGGKVGTWAGSYDPLSDTLIQRSHPEHIERVSVSNRVGEMEWGSARHYAGAFDAGGPVQRWDDVPQPARPLRPVQSSKAAFHLAKAMQRVLVGRLNLTRTSPLDRTAGEGLPRVTL